MTNDLKRHLYIEFRLGREPSNDKIISEKVRNRLWEEHGLIPDMDRYVDVVGDAVREMISNNQRGCDIISRTLTKEDFNFKTFFDEITVPIYILYEDADGIFSRGEYASSRSGEREGRYVVEMNNFVLSGKKGEDFATEAKVLMAHEITHAYEDWKRRCNDVDDLEKSGLKSGLFNATFKAENGSSSLEKAISGLIYFTDKFEVNAYIAQTREEIEPYLDRISDSRSGWNVIERTQTYRTLAAYFNLIETLKTLDASRQGKVVEIFKDIKNEALSFNSIVSFLRKRLERFWRKYVSQVSKMVYDLYCENRFPALDEGIVFGRLVKEAMSQIEKED